MIRLFGMWHACCLYLITSKSWQGYLLLVCPDSLESRWVRLGHDHVALKIACLQTRNSLGLLWIRNSSQSGATLLSKAIARQAQDLSLNPQNPCKSATVVCACNPRAIERWEGGRRENPQETIDCLAWRMSGEQPRDLVSDEVER